MEATQGRLHARDANVLGLLGRPRRHSLNAPALEQTGTEVDCSPSGRIVSSAWYELVPGPSVPIRLDVRPGDRIRATVKVSGHRATIRLDDLTRHRGFHRTAFAARIDDSSAESIMSSSECVSAGSCQTLPLANFAPTRFGAAAVRSTSGHTGTISDPAWAWTRITLTPGGHHFSVHGPSRASAATARPSSLLSEGSAFAVNYAEVQMPLGPLAARAASLGAGELYHLSGLPRPLGGP